MSTAPSMPLFGPPRPADARPAWWGALAALALASAIGALSWQVRLPMSAASGARSSAAPASGHAEAPTAQRLKSLDSGARQLRFEPNRGQTAADVRYLARGASQQVAIFDDGMAFSAVRHDTGPAAGDASTRSATAQLRLINARPGTAFIEAEALPSRSHHLIGPDASQWQRALPQFKQLRQAQVYPGIDLVYYSRDGEFEFDFVVMPGADPRAIRLQISPPSPGMAKPVIDAQGELLLDGQGGLLRIKKPVLYQHIDGQKVMLDARWVLSASGALSFALPAYDKRQVLVIDPVFKLLHSTYLGGVHDDQVGSLVLDAQGNAYIVGNSGSEDWPVSGNAYQTRRKNLGVYVRNVVVTKFDAAGTLLWSTFLGGSVNDYGSAIAIDAAGQVVIGGTTTSADFPTTAGAHQNTLRGGTNGFVAVLSPDGSSLVQSTLYGGTGTSGVNALALDSAGNVVIAGNAGTGLATTTGAYKATLATGTAAYVARFSPSTGGAMQLLAASYYGTDTPESNSSTTGNIVHGMTLDASGAAWIAGQAFTTRLPTTASALQTAPTEIDLSCRNGVSPLNSFAYVARLSPDLKTLPFASYLSGKQRVPGQQVCSEFAISIKLDAAGDVYVHGATASDKFPTTAGTPQPVYPGNNGFTGYSAFITKIKGDVPRVLWSSYLGGNGGNTFAGRIAIDAGTGSLWLPLFTGGGANFPITTDAQQKLYGGGASDAALVQLDASTGALKYSSYMGGSGDDIGLVVAIDGGGNAFVAGTTTSRDFAVTGNAFQPAYTAAAFDGADWFFRIVGSATVGSPRPARGGNTGDVTFSLSGAGLESVTSAELVGQGQTIVAASTSALPSADLSATFALKGALPGKYSVVLRGADGLSITKADAFEVVAGGKPDVAVTIVGRSKIRNNTPATFNINVANTGTVDSYFQTLWISFPSNVEFQLKNIIFISEKNISIPGSDDADGRHYVGIILPRIAANSSHAIALVVTDSVGNRNIDVQAYLKFPWFSSLSEATAYFENLVLRPELLGAGCVQSAASGISLNNCFANAVKQTESRINSLIASLNASNPTKPIAAYSRQNITKTYASDMLVALRTSLSRVDQSATAAPQKNVLSASDLGKKKPQVDVIKFVQHVIFGTDYDSEVMKFADEIHKGIFEGIHREFHFVKTKTKYSLIGCEQYQITETWCNVFTPYDCHDYSYRQSVNQDPPGWKPKPNNGAGSCPAPSSQSASRSHALSLARPLAAGDSCPEPPNDDAVQPPAAGSCSQSAGAIDPNDKSGPTGDGSPGHWLRQTMPLPYQIAFENLPTATLPAAEVVVTDQLDPSKVDLSTLTLGNISWGPFSINVPAGLNTYSIIFPINASMSVRVAGSLNPTTGLLKWTFTTIDPLTKLPPSDPTLGFLPPNKNGTEGQGYVNFTISPKAGLGDGTRWENFASIVFDRNAPILTPMWVNTLDTTVPFSRVASVTQKATGTDLDVTWSGSDAGSGVRRYSVYVSDNGGAFSAWQSNVTTTSATYSGGVVGRTYGFNVVATDGAGNVEATRLTADTSVIVRDTTVVPPPPPPPPPATGGGGGCSIASSGDQRDASLPLLLVAAGVVLVWRRRLAAHAAWR